MHGEVFDLMTFKDPSIQQDVGVCRAIDARELLVSICDVVRRLQAVVVGAEVERRREVPAWATATIEAAATAAVLAGTVKQRQLFRADIPWLQN